MIDVRRCAFAAGLTAALVLTGSPARAEVLKTLQICAGQQLCPAFELVLTPPKDWIEDKEASRENKVEVMVPRGRSFGNADAVMYVKVSHRQDDQDLADFVRVSQERWRAAVRDTKISALPDVERTGGRPAFKSFRYENPSRPQQRFEAVSFGLDQDKDGNAYFVMVALTGKDKKAVDQAMARYGAFLRAH